MGSMQQSPSVSEGLLSPDEMLSTDDYFGRRRSTSVSGHSAHSNDHGASNSSCWLALPHASCVKTQVGMRRLHVQSSVAQ